MSAVPTGWLVGVVAACGIAGSAVGGFALAGEPGEPVELGTRTARSAVGFGWCPGAPAIGAVHDLDEVLLTARNDDGSFVQFRHPQDLDRRVWLPTEHVDPSTPVDDLPVVECRDERTTSGEPAELAAPTPESEEETPSEDDAASDTSTTTVDERLPSTTTTTAPMEQSPTSPPPTAPVTTTKPPPDTGPTISAVSFSEPAIWETCDSSSKPGSSTVSASVEDPDGIASVTMRYEVAGSGSHSVAMAATSGRHRATIGDFGVDALPYQESTTISVTIEAVDGNGEKTVRPVGSLTLHDNDDECLN